ncbi:MAG: hypothetical protein HUU29_10575 [Planctomycetaceae bacterium]|nr:hypothetical protein [Planctomycetaceae bacterium]
MGENAPSPHSSTFTTMSKFLSYFALFALCILPAQSITADNKKSYEFVSNLGKTVLSSVDLIVTGAVSKTETKQGTVTHREVAIDAKLWGTTKETKLAVVYTDPTSFASTDGRIALALKKTEGSTSRYLLFGKPMPAKDDAALDALKDYIAVDSSDKNTDERADLLYSTILNHLKSGGAKAKLASVELIFLVKNHTRACTHTRYDELTALLSLSTDERVRRDVNTSLKGMIATALKTGTFVELLRAKTAEDRNAALDHLERYIKDHPDAFDASDAERCDVAATNLDGKERNRLDAVKQSIDDAVKARAAAQPQPGNADPDAPAPQQPKPEDADPESPFAAPKG